MRPDRFQRRRGLLNRLAREHHAELLSTVSVRGAATAHPVYPGRHHTQHFIADIVAMFVVKLFEVIHIQHRNAVPASQPVEAFSERTPAQQPGELIAIGHGVRAAQQPPHQAEPTGNTHHYGDILQVKQRQRQVECHQRTQQRYISFVIAQDHQHQAGNQYQGHQQRGAMGKDIAL